MKFAYANIKNNPDMEDDQVRSDIRKVGSLAGLIGWQEIGEGADHKALEQTLDKGWDHLFDDLAIPVSFQTDEWKVKWTKEVKTHGGKAKVTPPRFVVGACLARRDDPEKKIVYCNTHYISGAWSSPPKDPMPWRRDMWKQHYGIMQDLIKGWVNDGEHTVITVGDFNRKDVPKFMDSQKWIENQNNQIDKSMWMPGGTVKLTDIKWNVVTDDETYHNTDHNPTWVKANLVVK